MLEGEKRRERRDQRQPPNNLRPMAAPRFGDRYYDPAQHYNTTTTNHHFSPPVSPRSSPHGIKRRASDENIDNNANTQINHDFKKLRLNSRHAKAVSQVEANGTSCDINPHSTSISDGAVPVAPFPCAYPPSRHAESAEDYSMPVDDTADRVYIGDLEAEIAAIEAEEAQQRAEREQQLMLSQAGQDMLQIPAHLLRPQRYQDSPASNMQMVLYRDPTSISVPEEEDAVRKTIIAARARARERQKDQSHIQSSLLHEAESRIDVDDPDAMDLG